MQKWQAVHSSLAPESVSAAGPEQQPQGAPPCCMWHPGAVACDDIHLQAWALSAALPAVHASQLDCLKHTVVSAWQHACCMAVAFMKTGLACLCGFRAQKRERQACKLLLNVQRTKSRSFDLTTRHTIFLIQAHTVCMNCASACSVCRWRQLPSRL